jgi:periplasmic divalent cation tolerance protein
MLIVFTTCPTAEEAHTLAERIVHEQLAACVQVLPQMTSFYVWEGEVKREPEHLLLIKTLGGKYDQLESFIRANHSYSVPEIVAIDAARQSQPYLAWVKELLG